MEHLEQLLLKNASGEHRFAPDQQRRHLGTFQERVVLALTPSDLTDEAIAIFPHVLKQLKTTYSPVTLKLAGSIPLSTQLAFMKIAKQADIPCTTIQEQGSSNNYALVLHTDHAVECQDTTLSNWLTKPSSQKPEQEKPAFWKRFFHKQQ